MYAVKSIAEFLNCYNQGMPLELSAKFTYRPAQMRFSKEEEAVLLLLQSHMPPRSGGGRGTGRRAPPGEGRFLILSGAFLQSVMRFFERHAFYLMLDGERRLQSHIRTAEIAAVLFRFAWKAGALSVTAQGAEDPPHSHAGRALRVRRRGDQTPAQRAGARMQAAVRARAYVYLSGRGGGGHAVGAFARRCPSSARCCPRRSFPTGSSASRSNRACTWTWSGGNVEARVELHYGDT